MVIQLQHVHKQFHKKEVIHDVSLTVNKGEIFGMLGPSGAGKTTIVKMIAGIDTATKGELHVLGTRMPNLQTMARLGFMAQSDALYGELTALENLHFFASIYGLKGKKRKDRIEEVLELVNLTDDMKKAVHQFSGGMKRRLSLAAALLHEPEVLILDEPTVGIDPLLRQAIWEELERIRQKGTTIVVTTHVMDEADKCMRLAMIRDGRLIAVGSPDELKKQTGALTIEQAFLHFGGMQS
ncbi:ABC transporter ATP-binding protein [Anoxybacillus sp. LAT_35]|uniref:ABC transporter ATP-binding protein n=1 Tax=unclassified Anoxybacillus TaxID=2639704 RepID=UPI001EDBB77F|nr:MULTISPECIES: ABC transporter ATP-binding protein [unclassified Anoxybacillus]MCG5025512.1 ABC transporter ATP-binding protein [Anoxybacillus flavithermus]MCG6196463.1 ABC transporter ATP-binding protein [Anoxybacillus sp. LAT_38]MCG3083824.1 ABC transporter ATP-binding protein [Anoxybacillus sp. LAT27]MCG3085465.1 ABC transporter ATP-binding protein [Anoxybacillus sp. LAT27]MCG6170487.1 ABC transporter ATP-binding protein [Anoxybacillus sp. LAT_11]